jgi:hypothetical protein
VSATDSSVTHVREFGGVVYGLQFEYGPRLSRRVVFNSHALAKYYEREVPNSQARVVYDAVTVPATAAAEPADGTESGADSVFRCVMVGMVIEANGPEEAIRAVHETVRRGFPVG